MSVDFNSAGLLLHVIEKCANNPRLNSLAGMANVELDRFNADAKNDLDERAAEMRKDQQVAQAKVLAAAPEPQPEPVTTPTPQGVVVPEPTPTIAQPIAEPTPILAERKV